MESIGRKANGTPEFSTVFDRFQTGQFRPRLHWPPQLGLRAFYTRRFAPFLFLEGLVSSDVRPEEASLRHFVEAVNRPLRACSVELRESSTDGGDPAFQLVCIRDVAMGRLKNLIFAAPIKPDLRLCDALDNDIEIVTNADKVLVYDRPIGAEGLRWRDLQTWWSETKGYPNDNKAKKDLYHRLKECLPSISPPQILLFDVFFKTFGKRIPDVPALLPEVWLHSDPKMVKKRGADALSRFRMDFLMLLPNGTRAVIEVDGLHHYARSDGSADCREYAAMVAADRELKLAGYHVFRFGAAELLGDSAFAVVEKFFKALFERFDVQIS